MRRARAGGRPARRLESFVVVLGLFLTVAFTADEAKAQFRNNGMKLPSVGWFAMNPSAEWLNEAVGGPGNRWNASDQLTLGVGYFRAVGYNLWFDVDTVLGLGGQLSTGTVERTLVSLQVSLGLRYNFLDEKHRPFVAGYIQYLQFFNVAETIVAGNDQLGGYPLWVGLRPTVGYEWFFLEEMSFQGEVAPIVFLGLDAFAPKFSALVRLSYNVYF